MTDVLFVCVHNSGRSQMAEALFNQMAAERGMGLRAGSAGTQPAESIDPTVAEAMRELGIDLSPERPKPLTDAMAEDAERVITMGCVVDAGACPAILLKNVQDWGLPDPKGRSLIEVRAIRDEVARRVEALMAALADPS